ncbi:hypothetical protein [Lentzea sp. NPDC055074]
MAPCFDIYVRLPVLHRPDVERFLENHVSAWHEPATWLSEDAAEILESGLSGSQPGEVLCTYRGLHRADLERVMLAFPRDGGVVLGVSVDHEQDDAISEAERWLGLLLEETGAPQGFVQAEEPPPLSEAEWQDAMGRAFRRGVGG